MGRLLFDVKQSVMDTSGGVCTPGDGLDNLARGAAIAGAQCWS